MLGDRERIDDGHGGVLGILLDDLLLKRPHSHDVDVAAERTSNVFYGLALAQPHLLGAKVDGLATEVTHPT